MDAYAVYCSFIAVVSLQMDSQDPTQDMISVADLLEELNTQ